MPETEEKGREKGPSAKAGKTDIRREQTRLIRRWILTDVLILGIVACVFLKLGAGTLMVYCVEKGNLRLLKVLALIERDLSHVHELRPPSLVGCDQTPGTYVLGTSYRWCQATLLHDAIFYRQQHVAEWLLEKGLDPNTRNFMGETPLHYAIRVNDRSLVDFLLEHGADLNVKRGGMTVFSYAVSHYDMFMYLVDLNGRPPDPTIVEEGGDTLLHRACDLSKDDPRVVQYLLSVGFDPNARGYEGSTPLHHAARAGYPRKVAALLEAGAKIDVLDEVGSPLQTGWSVAPRVTDKDVLDLLKNYDADYPGKFEKQEEEKTPV